MSYVLLNSTTIIINSNDRVGQCSGLKSIDAEPSGRRC